ncbi:MAG: HD family phosphohydrolase [Bacillus sp. (in: firmicutes)]
MNLNKYMVKAKNLLQHTFLQIILFAFLAVLSFGLMFSNVKPEKIDVELLQVAEMTIRAPKTVDDEEKTEEERQEAVSEVAPVYTLKKEYAQNRVDLIASIFDSAAEVKKELKTEEETTDDALDDGKAVDLLKEKLTAKVNKEFSDEVYLALLQSSESEMKTAKENTLNSIELVMSNAIGSDDVADAKKQVADDLSLKMISSNLKEASIELAKYAVVQNYFYDATKTDEQKDKAYDSVEPVKILQGQVLVEKGQLVDHEVYRNLELAGVLNTDKSVLPFVGLGVLVMFIFAALLYFYRNNERKYGKNPAQLLIFSLVYILSIVMIKGISLLTTVDGDVLSFVFPAALGTMLLKVLLDDRYAVSFTLMFSIFGAIIFNDDATNNFNASIGIYILMSGFSAILLLSINQLRTRLFHLGLLLSLAQLIIILGLVLTMDLQVSNIDYVYYIVEAILSGMTSAILTIGLLPFFESTFGILSSMKLVELSNPNHPLLRKILTETPGTYHHSVMVANLAEAACEAIGANGLLARVGCYYHDIGKTKRPQFFIENQMSIENPHDRLQPETSKNIIIAHVTDGVKILRKHKMPKEIIEIAEQHHGTGLLKFFYYKAKELGEDVKEEDYRYSGPKPQTKETAVINIADSVEAAVRSMKQPTKEKIEALVKSIIHDRINDGQFSECDITLRELNIVEETLCQTLNGIFHSRIEYPDAKIESK